VGGGSSRHSVISVAAYLTTGWPWRAFLVPGETESRNELHGVLAFDNCSSVPRCLVARTAALLQLCHLPASCGGALVKWSNWERGLCTSCVTAAEFEIA
jgi:hypothetical protein